MKCAQTGKELVVKPKSLSPEDEEPLSKGHFTPGCGLMLEEEGKPYPVQFVCFAGKHTHYKHTHAKHTHIHSEMCIILLTLDEKRKKKGEQKKKEQRDDKREERREAKRGQQKENAPPKHLQLADKTNLTPKEVTGKTRGPEKESSKRKREADLSKVKDISFKAKAAQSETIPLEPSPKRRRETAQITNLDEEDKVTNRCCNGV